MMHSSVHTAAMAEAQTTQAQAQAQPTVAAQPLPADVRHQHIPAAAEAMAATLSQSVEPALQQLVDMLAELE